MVTNDKLAKKFFEKGQQVRSSITIQRTAREIYASCMSLEKLPRFVEILTSARRESPDKFAWSGRSADGMEMTSEADIVNSEEGRLFAWRSNENADMPNAGSITLNELPFQRGTEVRVVIEFIPSSELSGSADKMKRAPEEMLKLALMRFRQFMETGEIATTKGQPAGASRGRDIEGSNDEKKFAEGVRA